MHAVLSDHGTDHGGRDVGYAGERGRERKTETEREKERDRSQANRSAHRLPLCKSYACVDCTRTFFYGDDAETSCLAFFSISTRELLTPRTVPRLSRGD